MAIDAIPNSSDPTPAPPPAATDAIPDSASATAAGFKKYLVDLEADQPETKEGLDVSAFSPKLEEDTEPQAVN